MNKCIIIKYVAFMDTPLSFSNDFISITFLQEIFTLFPIMWLFLLFNYFIFTFIEIIIINLFLKLEFSYILALLKLSELAAMSPIMKQNAIFKSFLLVTLNLAAFNGKTRNKNLN